MTRGGPDYIADPRLSQLEFDKLQTYMLLLAVEDPGARKDGTSSAIQGARTRFALATLAEARGWSLEDLLLEWVGPPVVVEGGGTAKAPGAAPPTESKDETPGTNAPPSYRAPYDVAHVPTTPLDEELAEATRRAEEMMREAEEASAYSSHSRIVAETALREYNALLDTVDVAHFGTRNLLDRSKAKAEQAAALAVAAAEAAADAEDMQAAATREMHAVGAARHQVMVEERAATTAIHFEAEARRQKQRMDEAAAKANTAAAATRAAREAKQAEEAKAAAEAAAKARAEEAEAMAKLAAESAAIRADGDVQRKKWEKEAEAVRRAEMLAARSAARRSKYEPPPFHTSLGHPGDTLAALGATCHALLTALGATCHVPLTAHGAPCRRYARQNEERVRIAKTIPKTLDTASIELAEALKLTSTAKAADIKAKAELRTQDDDRVARAKDGLMPAALEAKWMQNKEREEKRRAEAAKLAAAEAEVATRVKARREMSDLEGKAQVCNDASSITPRNATWLLQATTPRHATCSRARCVPPLVWHRTLSSRQRLR